MKKALFVLLGLILVISLMLVACKSTPSTTTKTTAPVTTTSKPPTTTAPTTTTTPTTTAAATPSGDQYGGTWVEGLSAAPGRPIGYPPEAAPDSWSDSIMCLEGLVRMQSDGTIVPCLATSWTPSADGLSITLNLRKGVKFHDGSDFNADVAVWNMGINLAAKQIGTNNWKSIDKIDDYTIRVTFTSPGNTNLAYLAGGPTFQISKAYFDKNGISGTEWHPVGTGPFIFQSYETSSKITYTRNPNYWDTGKPYLDSVVLTVIPDSTVRKLAFQKGDINRLAAQGLDAVTLQQAGYPFQTAPGGTFLLNPDSNIATQPWSNVNVRFAASYAINRDALCKALGFGFLNPAYQIYPGYPSMHIDGLIPTTFNQAKAKDLLTQAGYPTGFKTTIHTNMRVMSVDYSTAIAAQLGAVGINCATDSPESGAWNNLYYNGWSDGLLNNGFGNLSNPNMNFMFYFESMALPSEKNPPGLIAGINASVLTPTVDKAKVQTVIQLLYDDMTVIPYAEQVSVTFYKKGSHDPDANAYGVSWPNFWDCWIDKSAR